MKTFEMPKHAIANRKSKPAKAYNMAAIDDDSAEINMYGDVVSEVPRDWWTNERLPGYIGADEFLEDLEEIKDKGNITVHINSSGGDLYAGLAIYNRLKALPGTVTTINDAIAASAASLIFQAGDIRQMNAGSTFMAHGASGLLIGWYDIDDLKTLVAEFKAHNKAIVNVYAEAMGVTFDEAKGFIDGETWLVGQEAVDKGLADEVIDSDAQEVDEEENLLERLMNRVRSVYGTPVANDAKEANTAQAPIADIKESIGTGGKEDMDIRNTTELRDAFPELVAEVEAAAKIEGAGEERDRLKGIEEIENTISNRSIVNDAKYGENPLTAEQLALKAMKEQAAIGSNMLDDMQQDTDNSGVAKVAAAPTNEAGDEDVGMVAKNLAGMVNGMRTGGKR